MDLFEDLLSINDNDQDAHKTIQGITTGTVRENWDEEHPGMVKVEFFLGDEGQTLTDWIRVAQPYAGNGYGVYWLPEVGDEVVLAFNMGDVNRPYVLGSLWNNVDVIPDDTAQEENYVKRVKTKGGHEIVFAEEEGKEKIEIHTPNQLQITLEDETKMITIQDENGDNMLQIDGENGKITVTASKAITLDAGGNATLELDGEGNSATLSAGSITIEAQQELNLSGQNFNAEGNMVGIKGNSKVTVESSGILELKGSMTKING